MLKDVQMSKFLSITLTDQRKTFKKKLLKTMDISTLRMLVRRLFGLENDAEFELWHLSGGKEVSKKSRSLSRVVQVLIPETFFSSIQNQNCKSKLDQNERDLKFYSINDNATIEIVI